MKEERAAFRPWPKEPTRWIRDRTLYISIPFTWNLPAIRNLCIQHDFRYDKIVAGGPAVRLMPGYLKGLPNVKTRNRFPGALQLVNPQATRTTEGCPNKCRFCGVKRVYPRYKELASWPLLPIVCDDNLLASSKAHLSQVFSRLGTLPWVDFSQGLEAKLITKPIAANLAALNKPLIRLAWDKISEERHVLAGIQRLRDAGIPKRQIRCYVLIGWKDEPSEALYRLQTLQALGIDPSPMRYNPLDALQRDIYVNTECGWSHDLLNTYMRYWYRLRYFRHVPFVEFRRKRSARRQGKTREGIDDLF